MTEDDAFDSWWVDVLSIAAARGWRSMFHRPERSHWRDYNAGLSPADAAIKHIRGIE